MKKLVTLILISCGLVAAQDIDTHWFGYTFQSSDGTALNAGEVAYVPLPAGCSKLTAYDILINQPGTARIDVWRRPYPYWPTSSNIITGGYSPTIRYGHHHYSSSLSTWETAVLPHDTFGFYLDYITGGATQATLVLSCQ